MTQVKRAITDISRSCSDLQAVDRGQRMMTRILLYSDEPILAKGLESVLRQVEGFELLPTCSTVAGVMEQVAHVESPTWS